MTQKQQHAETFQIEYRGNTYACERVIRGAQTLTQQIHVIGVGSKHDSARYGRNGHPIETMAGIARIIVREILDTKQG
jgi:hypothetical protein